VQVEKVLGKCPLANVKCFGVVGWLWVKRVKRRRNSAEEEKKNLSSKRLSGRRCSGMTQVLQIVEKGGIQTGWGRKKRVRPVSEALSTLGHNTRDGKIGKKDSGEELWKE